MWWKMGSQRMYSCQRTGVCFFWGVFCCFISVCGKWTRNSLNNTTAENVWRNNSHDEICQCLEKQLHQLPCEGQTLQITGMLWTDFMDVSTGHSQQTLSRGCSPLKTSISGGCYIIQSTTDNWIRKTASCQPCWRTSTPDPVWSHHITFPVKDNPTLDSRRGAKKRQTEKVLDG